MPTQTTKHPLAEILYAIADGKEVQQRTLSYGTSEWKKLDYHSAFSLGIPNVEYRIKPKEKVKKWKWVFEVHGELGVTEEHYTEEEFNNSANAYFAKLIQKIDATEQEFDE